MPIFFKRYGELLIILTCILFVFFYSLNTLTTKPRLSFDEGFFYEEAHNLSQLGRLDIITAPDTFSGLPHIANSSGISASLPLSAVFTVFGFGIEQGRLYALSWMIVCLLAVYFFCRRFFGVFPALGTLFLLLTFPPFHANGRMVMGEIPGFTYLIFSLLFLSRFPFTGGLFLGLSVVARPSVYMWAFIAVAFQMLLTKKLEAIKPLLKVGAGALVPAVASLLIFLPNSLTVEWWYATFLFFKIPTFGIEYSLSESVLNNVISFGSHPTLAYLLLSLIAIIFGFYIKGKELWDKETLIFCSVYGVCILAYFLKSPGWFKYLLPLQLLVLCYLPSALFFIAERMAEWCKKIARLVVSPKVLVVGVLVILFSIHTVQLFLFADIFESTDVQQSEQFLHSHFYKDTPIAFIHAPQVAMLFPAERKYSFIAVNENLVIGQNPLGLEKEKLVPVLVMPDNLSRFSTQFQGQYAETLKNRYTLERKIGRFNVYRLR